MTPILKTSIVENLVANRRNRFINRYGERQLFMSNVALIGSFVISVCLFIAFVQFLFAKFIHLCCATIYDGEIKLYVYIYIHCGSK